MTTSRRHFGSVRKLPSGRYQASYWHEGARHLAPNTFKTKADALAHLSITEADLHRSAWVDPAAGRLSVAQLVPAWLESNARKRASTRARDETILRLHVVPTLGKRAVAKVSPVDVQSLVDSWSEDYAPATVGRMYSCLAAMFAYAVNADRIVKTPCRRIRLPKVALVDRPEVAPKQLTRLADALGGDQAVMMWVGAVLGLRWAETAGLTVDRLLLSGEPSITVDRQLDRNGRLSEPKSAAGNRTMAMPIWLARKLRAVLNRRGLTAADGDALVFVAPEGDALRYSNWRRRTWKPACQKANLPNLRFHDLRSLSASVLVATGVDVKTAQHRLGHSSSQVTLDVYARATAAADREAAQRIGRHLRPVLDRARGAHATAASQTRQTKTRR